MFRNRERVGEGGQAPPCQPARRSQNEGGACPAGGEVRSEKSNQPRPAPLPPAFPRVCRGGRLGERLHCLHRAGNDIRLWRMRRPQVGEAGELAGQSSSPAEQAGRGRRCVDWRRSFGAGRFAEANEVVTMTRRFRACIIDASWRVAKRLRHVARPLCDVCSTRPVRFPAQ